MRLTISIAVPVVGTIFAATPALAQAVQTDAPTYEVGERVIVSFSGCPGSGTDWVGIYPASQQQNQGSTYWRYCQGGQTPGTTGPASGSLTFLPFSLPPGAWQVRLFFNNTYTLRAVTNFSIISRAAAPTPPPPPQANLTVMSFNIWVSGSNVPNGLTHAVNAVRETGADIVGFQECSAAAVAQILSQFHADPLYAAAGGVGNGDSAVVSRWGIETSHTGAGLRGVGARVRLPSGEAVRFFSCHLTPYPYGPYSIRDGRGVAATLADEQATRVVDITSMMSQLTEPAGNEPWLTTFIVGDFNCPSHLDWTDANRSQNYGQVVLWPVTRILSDAGYLDTYRQVHPDPVAGRGLTWTSGAPRDNLDHNDVHDRIDMIHFRPRTNLTLQAVQAYTLDRQPWPSDHRAMVASLNLGVPCAADFNHDCSVNSQDFFDFLAAFFTGCG